MQLDGMGLHAYATSYATAFLLVAACSSCVLSISVPVSLPRESMVAPSSSPSPSPPVVCSLWIQFLIHVTLFCGAYASNSKKAIFDYPTEGECGVRPFRKPWMLCFVMFAGESLCLVVETVNQYVEATRKRKKSRQIRTRFAAPVDEVEAEAEAPLLGETDQLYSFSSTYQSTTVAVSPSSSSSINCVSSNPALPSPSRFYYLLFALFDLSATSIGGYGLIYISASANQMLRGSMLMFTALFSIVFLNSKLNRRHWIGILLVMGGEAGVGISTSTRSYFSSSSSSSSSSSPSILSHTLTDELFGIFLILVSSAINSFQNVIEEGILKSNTFSPVNPLSMVGWEGLFGAVLCLFLFPILQYLPGGDCGSLENSWDSLAMIRSEPILLVLMAFNSLSLAIMNWTSMSIGKLLSAVYRNLVNALRVVMVWLVALALYYVFTDGTQGEQFDRYSLIQAVGFGLVIGGTVIYSFGTMQRSENILQLARKLSLEAEREVMQEVQAEEAAEGIAIVRKG